MRAVADHRDAARVDRLDRAHRVALDARDLDEAANGITGQAEIMLHADLGRVLDLRVGAAQGRRQPRRRHRAGDADLALAADLGARDAGVALVERADRARREQEGPHPCIIAALAPPTKADHRRDNYRPAIVRRGDALSTPPLPPVPPPP